MKAVVAAFNQEKALVGAFSVIVQLHRLIVYGTNLFSMVHKCSSWWRTAEQEVVVTTLGEGSRAVK